MDSFPPTPKLHKKASVQPHEFLQEKSRVRGAINRSPEKSGRSPSRRPTSPIQQAPVQPCPAQIRAANGAHTADPNHFPDQPRRPQRVANRRPQRVADVIDRGPDGRPQKAADVIDASMTSAASEDRELCVFLNVPDIRHGAAQYGKDCMPLGLPEGLPVSGLWLLFIIGLIHYAFLKRHNVSNLS